jgi:hypothetical protein
MKLSMIIKKKIKKKSNGQRNWLPRDVAANIWFWRLSFYGKGLEP